MYNRVVKFLHKHKILNEHQFGFQKMKSTDQAIQVIHSKIIGSFEDKKLACSIFLDFAKAFDTVNHKILLQKLSNYGIRGIALNWFDSYLKNRPQCVKLGNTISKKLTIKCGVPQGSILGPLLFLIYINDISNSSKILDFHLFADDTSLFYSHQKIEVIEETVNNELLSVTKWLIANKLTLNVGKSNYIIFRPPQKNVKDITLKINNDEIEEKTHTKYLGVILDRHLSWKEHIHFLNLKLSKALGVLSKLRHCCSEKILKSVYYALFQAHVDYCINNWGCAQKSTIKKIEISLKKAVRIMLFKKHDEHAKPLFDKLGILDLKNLLKLNLGKQMWLVDNNLISESIRKQYINHLNADNRIKKIGIKYVALARTNYKSRFVTSKGPILWRDLPQNLKEKKSIKSFSKSYSKYLKLQI